MHGGFDIHILEKKLIILLVILYLFSQVLLIVKHRTNPSSERVIKINFLTNFKELCPSCRFCVS